MPPIDILDSRVFTIVTLRKRGHTEDEIASVTALYDSLDGPGQGMLSKLVALGNPQVVSDLVRILPDVREAIAKGRSKSVVEIVEHVAKQYE